MRSNLAQRAALEQALRRGQQQQQAAAGEGEGEAQARGGSETEDEERELAYQRQVQLVPRAFSFFCAGITTRASPSPFLC